MSNLTQAAINGISAITELSQTFVNCIRVFFKYGILGNSIRIEVSTLCQLQCPLCYRTYPEKMEVIGLGNLKFSDFKRFIDTYPEFKNIEITSKGEIFLNPELKDILRYAYEKKVNITALIGVNLNSITEEMIEWIVQYRIKGMTVSIDGASSQTYQLYRKGGDFDTVIANIKKINSIFGFFLHFNTCLAYQVNHFSWNDNHFIRCSSVQLLDGSFVCHHNFLDLRNG